MQFKRLFATLAMLVASPAALAGIEVLTNGDFETGDFTGWQVHETGGSALFVESGTVSPATARDTVGPAAGSHYALADGLVGATALVQPFSVGALTQATLSFDMFINSGASESIHASGLDPETGGSFDPNQHARVDILSGTADAFDTGADVLSTLFLGLAGPVDATNPYVHAEFDLSNVLAAGGSYQLRFAQVNNQGYLLQGIDNVSLQVTSVPEPATLALLAGGLAGLVVRRRPSV